jgi:hypothetical protein
MASMIEVTQDVVYELSGEKVTMPADSIVHSASVLVAAPEFKEGSETYETLITGATQVGPVVWRVTAEYDFTTQSINGIELVECPVGIEIIQDLEVTIVQVDCEDATH